MRVTPELLMIRKLNDLINKHKSKKSIPVAEIEEFKKDLEDMIKSEVGYSKLYILSASEYVDVDPKIS